MLMISRKDINFYATQDDEIKIFDFDWEMSSHLEVPDFHPANSKHAPKNGFTFRASVGKIVKFVL